GGLASPGPVTLICNSTVSPTAISELLSTAVTLGGSANAKSAATNVANTAMKICWNILERILQPSFRAESRNPVAQPTGKFAGCLDFARHDNPFLPVVIDMTLYSAFIKSNSRLFVFHRFK